MQRLAIKQRDCIHRFWSWPLISELKIMQFLVLLNFPSFVCSTNFR